MVEVTCPQGVNVEEATHSLDGTGLHELPDKDKQYINDFVFPMFCSQNECDIENCQALKHYALVAQKLKRMHDRFKERERLSHLNYLKEI